VPSFDFAKRKAVDLKTMRMLLLSVFLLSCSSQHKLETHQLSMQQPTAGVSESIGSYSSGCVRGASSLDVSSSDYELMRPGRGRFWAHNSTINHLEKIAKDFRSKTNEKIIIGDLGHAQGGPSLTGHSSHQSGLDADVWLSTMPQNLTYTLRERQLLPAVSVLKSAQREVDESKFSKSKIELIKTASDNFAVQRIFIHPAIKVYLCKIKDTLEWEDKSFKKLRPWWGHHYHMHLRFRCPKSSANCIAQNEPSEVECGEELAWWFLPGRGLNEPGSDKKIDYIDRYYERVQKLPEACAFGAR